MSLRSMAKKVIDYTIEEEYKVYRLKKTPFAYRRKFTKEFHNSCDHLPICENKIVFSNYMGGGYGCNGKYVLEYLLRHEAKLAQKLDLVWVVSGAEKKKEMFPPQVRLVEYGSKEAMREYATARIWVQNFQMVHYLNQGLLKREGQVYVQMWHGSFGIKKIEGGVGYLNRDKAWLALAKKNAAYTDYWISNSAFETQVYKESFWDVKQVLEFGHPRNDIFFEDMTEISKKVREHCGISEKQKIVLYVPTFRDQRKEQPAMPDVQRLLQSLEKRFGGSWVFALRNHPRLAGASQTHMTQEALVDVTDYPDIQELLAAADVVLTDYSSAIFDFVLTGKPGFLLVEDCEDYKTLRGLYYPPEESPFPVAHTQQELWEKVENFDEDEYAKRVEEFLRQKGSVEDGSAAGRVADLIRGIIENK